MQRLIRMSSQWGGSSDYRGRIARKQTGSLVMDLIIPILQSVSPIRSKEAVIHEHKHLYIKLCQEARRTKDPTSCFGHKQWKIEQVHFIIITLIHKCPNAFVISHLFRNGIYFLKLSESVMQITATSRDTARHKFHKNDTRQALVLVVKKLNIFFH